MRGVDCLVAAVMVTSGRFQGKGHKIGVFILAGRAYLKQTLPQHMKDVPMTEPCGEQSPSYQTSENQPAGLIEDPAADCAAGVDAGGAADAGTSAAYQLPANPTALARLSFATAVVIASLVCLQDAVAIIPASSDFSQWVIRVAGLWLSAYLLWAIGFWGLCLLVGIIGGGIRIDRDGIRLWRFGKKVLWKDIRAVGLEEQPVFSGVFLLRPPAARITIYCVRKTKPGKKRKPGQPGQIDNPEPDKKATPGLATIAIPSFSFDPGDFNSLFGHITQRAFRFVPDSAKVNISTPAVREDLKKACLTGRVKRIVVSCFIAGSLVFLLGRRALTNYYYNDAYRLLRLEQIESARDGFAKAIAVDPTYAVAWDRLARMEYRLGDAAAAKKHWERALMLKPDLVDSKIGLASIAVKQCRFSDARALLLKSIQLQPRYVNGYLSMADLELRTGSPMKAQKLLQFVLKQEPKNHKATLLLARTKMERDDLKGALALLSSKPPAPSTMDKQFELLVDAEYLTKVGKFEEARKKLDALERSDSTSYEVFLVAGILHQAMGQDYVAQKYFERALKTRPSEVWPLLYESEMALKAGRRSEADVLMERATNRPVYDSGALVRAAQLLSMVGKQERARELVMIALELDPSNEAGMRAIQALMPETSK
jgi:Tfp pilus assembly protein PilF